MFHEIKVQNARDQIRHFEVARGTGRDGCESALWDCLGGQICRHVENASPKTVPQCKSKIMPDKYIPHYVTAA